MACFVLRCTSKSWKDDYLKFHHFPTDPERRKEWIKACRRQELIDESPTFFKSKFVCSLHFDKTMYSKGMNNLLRSAVPTLQLTNTADSCTQTLEPIKFFTPSSYISKVPDKVLKKIELRTWHTQTEEYMPLVNKNVEIKKENDITQTHIEKYNMQCDDLEIKGKTQIKEEVIEDKLEVEEYVTKIEEDETAMTTDKILPSSDSDQESEDETSDMSIDEFLKLNKGLEHEIRQDLKKNNIPQIPIQEATCSKDVTEIKGEYTDSEPESEGETCQRKEKEGRSKEESKVETSQTSVDEFLLDLNEGLEKQIGKALKKKNEAQIENATKKSTWFRFHKQTQTDPVTIFDIPKNNLCFEQCLRCGKNANKLEKKFKYRKKNYTIKDFQDACEKYLSPTFSNTVKNQIMLEYLLKKDKSQSQGQSQSKDQSQISF